MPSKPILIVDDDKAVRIALAELLEGEGYTVAGAPSGHEALQLMRGGLHPAVILLDLMMPGMDGWDFRSEQERDPAFSHVPVVIVSAAGFSQESIRTQFRPAAYFAKPLDRTKLLETIGRLYPAGTARGAEATLDDGVASSSAPGDLETTERTRESQDDGA
jgi:CheY-like chemotaxis protein